jgi:hypothetical protein
MPKHLVPIVATVFVMLFLWVSAVPLLSWYELTAYHQELEDKSFQWHHGGISDYNFEFEYRDFKARPAPGPIRIHVGDSKFVNASRIDTGELVDISGLAHVPDTIESAFAIATELLEQHPYRIDIEYDADLHYPTLIAVSYSEQESDGATYIIRQLQAADHSR